MDKRGHTIDPNRESLEQLAWWEKIGPSQKPSPYATASWTYWHDWKIEEEPKLTIEPISYMFDNGDDFAVSFHPQTVLDEGLFNRNTTGALVLDEGGFTQTGDPIKWEHHYFGTVKVFDTKASAPNSAYNDEVIVEDDRIIGHVARIVDPATLEVFDNSIDLQNPIPDPSRILDETTFDRLEDGELVSELIYKVTEVGTQVLIDPRVGDAMPDYDDDDFPSGKLLGEIHYEVSGTELTITEWSHYNWRDALPVKKAVRVLLNEVPDCVDRITVEESPDPFWKALGFVCPYKGSDILIHEGSTRRVSPY